MSEPKVGQPFGRYTIEAILGRGGMGVVYRATDSRLERVVALKTLGSERSADPAFRERFLRESRTLARLKHPHIVPIWEADEAAGELYIAMQYVEGQELGTLLERAGPLEPARAVELIAQVADALDAAHAAGLVHRDVKPANILVERGRRGILDHAYLTDFGLTKPVAALSGLTMAGQFVGTPGYVAPEQIEGKPVDHRADIYALGCVLYNCLTGTVPFPRDSTIAALWAHLWEPPPRPSEVRSELPAGFDAVVATALAKTPGERYQTAGALASAARAALASEVAVISDPVLASPPTSPTPGPTGRSDEGTGGSATGPTPAGSPPTFVDHVRPPTEPPGPPVPSTPPVSPPARVSLPWAGRLRRLPGTIAQRPVLFAGGATAFVVGLLVVALVGGAIRLGPASVPVSSPGASAGVATVAVSIGTTAPIIPSLPANFSATVVNPITVDLRWGASTGSVQGYNLYRDTALIRKVAANVLAFTDPGATPGMRHVYALEAFGVAGNSGRLEDSVLMGPKPPVADARLEGTFDVILEYVSEGYSNVDVGDKITGVWEMTPACGSGACGLSVDGVNLAGLQASLRLIEGAYEGSVKYGYTSVCAEAERFFTATVNIKVTGASFASDGRYVADTFSGTMNESQSAAAGCTNGGAKLTLTGRLTTD